MRQRLSAASNSTVSINDVLGALEAALILVPRIEVIEFTGALIAGNSVQVAHSLGVKPSIVFGLPYAQSRVWADEKDRAQWDETRVVVRCGIASEKMTLYVGTFD